MKTQNFGIEVELTGITRLKAAQIIAEYFGTDGVHHTHSYDTYYAKDEQGRQWKCVKDVSIEAQRKVQGRLVNANDDYKVELVSPICNYDDIEKIQEIVRLLRKSGAIANDSTGVHVHVNAAPHTTKSLRNIANIMRSKEDLLYKALQVDVARENRFCKKVDDDFIKELNSRKPQSLDQLKDIWYKGDDGSDQHYHNSRYRALNLHSVFQKGTIEFRLFNGTTHAGKLKSYIQLSLAISHQALTQKSASPARTASSNEKYTFRTWLLRLGLIGKEYKTARLHLLEHLDGNIAWKDPSKARLNSNINTVSPEIAENTMPEEEPEYEYGGINMSM